MNLEKIKTKIPELDTNRFKPPKISSLNAGYTVSPSIKPKGSFNLSGLSSFVPLIEGFIPNRQKDVNSLDSSVSTGLKGINSILLSTGNPYLMALGGIGSISNRLGLNSDASKGLGTLNDIGNSAMSVLSTYTLGLGALANKTDKLKEYDRINKSSSYGNIQRTDSYLKAKNNSNSKLFFGADKANELIREQNIKAFKVNDLLQKNDEDISARLNTQPLVNNRIEAILRNLKGLSISPYAVRAEQGGKLDIKEYKQGGNIIPSGALHARKHNIFENRPELKGNITHKGIPVISEGDKITQHAEIEHSEIIFEIDVTKKLEEWLEKWSKAEDKERKEIEIECGKYLVYQILENTEDKMNIIETIE